MSERTLALWSRALIRVDVVGPTSGHCAMRLLIARVRTHFNVHSWPNLRRHLHVGRDRRRAHSEPGTKPMRKSMLRSRWRNRFTQVAWHDECHNSLCCSQLSGVLGRLCGALRTVLNQTAVWRAATVAAPRLGLDTVIVQIDRDQSFVGCARVTNTFFPAHGENRSNTECTAFGVVFFVCDVCMCSTCRMSRKACDNSMLAVECTLSRPFVRSTLQSHLRPCANQVQLSAAADAKSMWYLYYIGVFCACSTGDAQRLWEEPFYFMRQKALHGAAINL